MGLIEHFEKLINEHGSAAILREQLALVKAQQAALERTSGDAQAKAQQLESENLQLRERLGYLGSQFDVLQHGNPAGYCCDHCGSPVLKRIGSRPDPTFSALGIKQAVFSCAVCGKESAFTQDR